MVVATLMKYSIHMVDNWLQHPWENRNVYLLYGELVTGICANVFVFSMSLQSGVDGGK